jgi:hypothetical protein
MTSSQLFRVGGAALVAGAAAFIAHIVARSIITSAADPLTFYREGLWVPINVVGAIGALLVLLGLPAMYARMAGSAGVLGFAGVVSIALAWIFFGVFLSLFGALVAPWLAEKAPALVGASSSLPTGFAIAFGAALLAWLLGAVLLAAPFLRGRERPRWIGVLLPLSALWASGGDLAAPSGPSSTLVVNLLSNLDPVLLLVALGYLGVRMYAEHGPAGRTESIVHPSAG